MVFHLIQTNVFYIFQNWKWQIIVFYTLKYYNVYHLWSSTLVSTDCSKEYILIFSFRISSSNHLLSLQHWVKNELFSLFSYDFNWIMVPLLTTFCVCAWLYNFFIAVSPAQPRKLINPLKRSNLTYSTSEYLIHEKFVKIQTNECSKTIVAFLDFMWKCVLMLIWFSCNSFT